MNKSKEQLPRLNKDIKYHYSWKDLAAPPKSSENQQTNPEKYDPKPILLSFYTQQISLMEMKATYPIYNSIKEK